MIWHVVTPVKRFIRVHTRSSSFMYNTCCRQLALLLRTSSPPPLLSDMHDDSGNIASWISSAKLYACFPWRSYLSLSTSSNSNSSLSYNSRVIQVTHKEESSALICFGASRAASCGGRSAGLVPNCDRRP